jgi:hypothetical protein
MILGRQQRGTACKVFPLVWRGTLTARPDKYTEAHLRTEAPDRRFKEGFVFHIEAWNLLTYGQIKRPEDVLALSLNLTRTEKMASLYADLLKA